MRSAVFIEADFTGEGHGCAHLPGFCAGQFDACCLDLLGSQLDVSFFLFFMGRLGGCSVRFFRLFAVTLLVGVVWCFSMALLGFMRVLIC